MSDSYTFEVNLSGGRRLRVTRRPVKDSKVRNDIDVRNSVVTWAFNDQLVIAAVRRLPGVVSVEWAQKNP